MSVPEPSQFDNTFDSFFNAQQAQRQSSSASQSSQPSQHGAQNGQHYNAPPFTGDRPMMEEPHSLSRRGSNTSLSSYHNRDRSTSRDGSQFAGSGTWRKESLPFDPENSSTLIATAQMQNQGGQSVGMQGVPMGNPVNQAYTPPPQFDYSGGMGSGQPPSTQSWSTPDLGNNQFSQFNDSNQQSPFSFTTGTPGIASPGFANSGEFFNQQMRGQGQQPGGQGWGNEYMGQPQSDDPQMDGFVNELERIISNSSHPSREPSPAPYQQNFDQQNSISPGPTFDPAFESAISSRSNSPMPGAMNVHSSISPPPAGSFQTGGSPNMASPFLNKPQSPPALIIPNQQPSPHQFPPIVTTTTESSNNQPPPRPQHGGANRNSIGGPIGLGNVSGGLQPPENPALKGLTGMDGISPIAPSADGPMIYVQPSTPISGLKDGRGVFEAVLRQTIQAQNQQNQTTGDATQQSGQTDMMNQFTQNTGQLPTDNQPTQMQFPQQTDQWNQAGQSAWENLRPLNTRPRAKSDSYYTSPTDGYSRQAIWAAMNNMNNGVQQQQQQGDADQFRNAIDQWRTTGMYGDNAAQQGQPSTLDPRNLPGSENDGSDRSNQANFSEQLAALQKQRDRMPPSYQTQNLQGPGGVKLEPGETSPTTLALYQKLGISPNQLSQLQGTASAPFFQSTFENIPQGQYPQTAAPGGSFLSPEMPGLGPRRRSFAEGLNHPAAGAGTPGYGVEFANPNPFSTLSPGRIRGGHRRNVQSEDWSRAGGTGWGVGQGGSTAGFLESITANDGTLLPPSRGRSHSRHSSASSARSASPALSISSQGSSYDPRMDLPEGVQLQGGKVAKLKVTSMATEVASTSRRTNEGVFQCPVPGCNSTFTRHFNLKGHLRSHNDERPYKCLYDGCPKAIVGFARQHDCKRHMLLHKGLRPFECEGCGKKFARLDALTRHHKSEQGQECALTHPLPTNPDGSAMSESQYKAYKAAQQPLEPPGKGTGTSGRGRGRGGRTSRGGGRLKSEASHSGLSTGGLSTDDRSGEEDLGNGSGMDDYDRI